MKRRFVGRQLLGAAAQGGGDRSISQRVVEAEEEGHTIEQAKHCCSKVLQLLQIQQLNF